MSDDNRKINNSKCSLFLVTKFKIFFSDQIKCGADERKTDNVSVMIVD